MTLGTNVLAKDIMSKNITCFTPNTTIGDAIKTLINQGITGAVVVDDKGALTGIVTEFDLISAGEYNKDQLPIKLEQKIPYSTKVLSVNEHSTLSEITLLCLRYDFFQVPVVDDNGLPVGMVNRRDILKIMYQKSFYDRFEKEFA